MTNRKDVPYITFKYKGYGQRIIMRNELTDLEETVRIFKDFLVTVGFQYDSIKNIDMIDSFEEMIDIGQGIEQEVGDFKEESLEDAIEKYRLTKASQELNDE